MSSEADTSSFTFTVFTATRNRAHTLPRVYESLKAQTFRDFEWLIVDNESTDGTPDLVARWQAEAPFSIRYLYQVNRGQQGSRNRAATEARGELFLTLDSDDSCPPTTLERFKAHWDSIPENVRPHFSGVTGHTVDEHGNRNGSDFPLDPTDSNSLEIRLRHKVTGEKFGFQRTTVMREFPLPEIEGYTGLMPNSLSWNAIARKYRTRYVNDDLKTYYTDEAVSLSRPTDYLEDVPGHLLEARSVIVDDLRWFPHAPWTFYLKAAKYSRSAFHAGLSPAAQFRDVMRPGTRLLWFAALPLGYLIYVTERLGFAHLLPGPRERNIARPRRSS
jgi:glycosyltransferase involved in cell wall biosynthesis